MKKILAFVPLVAILAACGSTNPYDKQAEREYDRKVNIA
jgi:uncharacterized lipoprotein